MDLEEGLGKRKRKPMTKGSRKEETNRRDEDGIRNGRRDKEKRKGMMKRRRKKRS